MLHHERLRPPSRDYPADEWNVIEKGARRRGGPNAENGTFINGFYERRPIVYGEDAYGFAKTGQTTCNVTDTSSSSCSWTTSPSGCQCDPYKLRSPAT